MEFETKIISRQIGDMLYASGLSLGTAESCTGGLISEAIIATPGASNYFKGSVVSYTNEIKERLQEERSSVKAKADEYKVFFILLLSDNRRYLTY